MAGVTDQPFPPGSYPVVVVGSGPGALQLTYDLTRLGLEHAVISSDEKPAGMFQRYPLFQRLISWSKPYAPVERTSRWYEWYDWNSLIPEDDEHRGLVTEFMDGTSYFPARSEMEQGLAAFGERTNIRVRYGCRWEGTRREDDGFTLLTSDGEYRCRVAVFAVGMTKPWKPMDIPGMEQVPHYVETKAPKEYAGKRVFILGKRNSGFELADGLLPWARQLILSSPRSARISILTSSTGAARARYLQPYEDALFGGGTLIIDAAVERIERKAEGFVVYAKGTTKPGDMTFEVDEVIAGTGFSTPMLDLPDLGVKTFYQGRLPSQTPFWESATVPGIYFAGSVTQGAIGLKKYGITSNSAAVHGFRYNAGVLARHVARTHFGIDPERPTLDPDDVVPFVLAETTRGPELWNQQAYLTRVLTIDPDRGIVDEGILPLAHFVDAAGPDAIAITVETGGDGDLHPALYFRHRNRVTEHLLPSNPLHDFETEEHKTELGGILAGVLG